MYKKLPFLILLLSLVTQLQAADHDIKGSKDHPLISRYENSMIIEHKQSDYDAFRLPLGALSRGGQGIKMGDSLDLEGRLTSLVYETKEKTSPLKVLRNFEQALKSAGFKGMFQCEGIKCGPVGMWASALRHDKMASSSWPTMRYLAMSRTQGDKGVYVTVFVADSLGRIRIGLNVIETKQMETGLVTVDAKMMDQQLMQHGRVAVYGIHFDTDRAELKEESFETLEQIRQLLEMKKELKLYIVGHTDDTGGLSHNIDLSHRRAQAVVTALVKRYGISANRIKSFGAGPYAPVASNLNDEGRAKNRRVELVQRLD
jgi:outer membrane protein OmpA-like peptidoglycan-associated protein